MNGWWYDLRLAWRTIRRMRAAAVVSVVTLALGAGATTTMFSVVYAALLRPVPFPDPARLVMLFLSRETPRGSDDRVRWSYAEAGRLRTDTRSFERVETFSRTSLAVELPEPRQMDGEVVSAGYFELLGMRPTSGRTFQREDDGETGAAPVVVISARLRRTYFANDPAIIGRLLPVNGVPLSIVGVLPDGFNGLSGRSDLWIPTAMAPRLTYADYRTTPQHFIPVIARLRPDVSVREASAEIAVIGPRVASSDATGSDATARWSGSVVPIDDARVDPARRRSALLLFAAIACVLLIACANVASLLVARMCDRRREIAVRSALGAGRGRLIRQLLTESLLLSALGGVVGVVVAAWGVRLIGLTSPSALPSTQTGYVQLSGFAEPSLDPAVLAFALGAVVITTLIFGAAPAFDAARLPLVGVLRDDDRTTARAGSRTLTGIVVAEIALAVLLLAGAGLFVTSYRQLQSLRAGFDPDRVLTFRIAPPASRYRPEDGPAVIQRVLEAVQRTPGVQMAAVNRCSPMNDACARTTLFFPGRPADPLPPVVERHYVSADYFRVLGIALLQGRALTDGDRLGRPPVTVVNETAAARYWPGESPIGKHIWFGSATGFTDPANPVEVVGVVADVKYGAVTEPRGPDFYTLYLQFAYPDTMVIVKAERSDPGALAPALRRSVASVDRSLPIYEVMTLDERSDDAVTRPKFLAGVLGVFAAVALLLAATGVYGVMSFAVASRTRELGIRVALGAGARQVTRMVLRESGRLAAIGGAIGIAAALGLGRVVRTLLIDVSPTDPRSLAAGAVALVAAALLAAYLPARRAARVDPMEALRRE